ncbi:MAG TPA: DUF1385 domain-containing protein [Thermomicrobiales bacterium]|nr:DUF1385 domain-containing protein [Thermomicrobiales bacterium]
MAKPFYYGGQAVMEGVMMRGRSSMAVAVRQPDGNICVYEEALQPGPVVTKVRNWPFIRGVFVLWDTLLLGMRALIFSANVGLQEVEGEEPARTGKDGKPEEPTMLTGPLLWATVGFSLLFSIALFFVAPLAAVDLLERWIDSHLLVNVIEGVLRLALLVGYMYAISFMPDIRRVFGYHGAEHMTINAHESNLPTTVENVRRQPLTHIRCGTGFLLIVVLLSVIVFIMIGRPAWYWLYLSRIVLVPVIAAVAYEVIRIGAANADNPIMRAILAPGLILQGVTTRTPDDGMLEVSIAAFKRVLATDAVIAEAELDPSIIPVDTMGRPLVPAFEQVPVAADGILT